VNRIKKKHFENIVIPRGSRLQVLTTWKKRYTMRLVSVGGLDSAVEAKK
jgi:hypothetical protein